MRSRQVRYPDFTLGSFILDCYTKLSVKGLFQSSRHGSAIKIFLHFCLNPSLLDCLVLGRRDLWGRTAGASLCRPPAGARSAARASRIKMLNIYSCASQTWRRKPVGLLIPHAACDLGEFFTSPGRAEVRSRCADLAVCISLEQPGGRWMSKCCLLPTHPGFLPAVREAESLVLPHILTGKSLVLSVGWCFPVACCLPSSCDNLGSARAR